MPIKIHCLQLSFCPILRSWALNVSTAYIYNVFKSLLVWLAYVAISVHNINTNRQLCQHDIIVGRLKHATGFLKTANDALETPMLTRFHISRWKLACYTLRNTATSNHFHTAWREKPNLNIWHIVSCNQPISAYYLVNNTTPDPTYISKYERKFKIVKMGCDLNAQTKSL